MTWLLRALWPQTGNGGSTYGGGDAGGGYVRVSTDRQVDAGAGLEVQRRAVRAWCRAEGHRLVDLVADAGVSGTLADRPALAEALVLLREGKAQGLVVHRLDRLARDLVVQEQLLAEVWRMGATVSSTAAGEDAYLRDDPGDPSRRLIRQVPTAGVIGAVSDYEGDDSPAPGDGTAPQGRRRRLRLRGAPVRLPLRWWRAGAPARGATRTRSHHRVAPGAVDSWRQGRRACAGLLPLLPMLVTGPAGATSGTRRCWPASSVGSRSERPGHEAPMQARERTASRPKRART